MSSRRYDTLATARDLESTGLERPQAEAIAQAIGSHGERLATQRRHRTARSPDCEQGRHCEARSPKREQGGLREARSRDQGGICWTRYEVRYEGRALPRPLDARRRHRRHHGRLEVLAVDEPARRGASWIRTASSSRPGETSNGSKSGSRRRRIWNGSGPISTALSGITAQASSPFSPPWSFCRSRAIPPLYPVVPVPGVPCLERPPDSCRGDGTARLFRTGHSSAVRCRSRWRRRHRTLERRDTWRSRGAVSHVSASHSLHVAHVPRQACARCRNDESVATHDAEAAGRRPERLRRAGGGVPDHCDSPDPLARACSPPTRWTCARRASPARRGATAVLAAMPGVAMVDAEMVPLLWSASFANAIVKLGRLRSPGPVALYYDPLHDVAVLTFWRREDGGWRVDSVRALPAERLEAPEAEGATPAVVDHRGGGSSGDHDPDHRGAPRRVPAGAPRGCGRARTRRAPPSPPPRRTCAPCCRASHGARPSVRGGPTRRSRGCVRRSRGSTAPWPHATPTY